MVKSRKEVAKQRRDQQHGKAEVMTDFRQDTLEGS